MSPQISLPLQLSASVGSEVQDFAVKAEHVQPFKKSIALVFFGLFWMIVVSSIAVAVIRPLLEGKEVHFIANGVPTVASPQNIAPMIVPGIVMVVCMLIGIFLFGFGLYFLLKKGGYFVGTSTRLVLYHNGTLRSIDWEQFSGNSEVSGSEQQGNLTLQLRTGKIVTRKRGRDQYVADRIDLAGIPNPFEIERICRQRIAEHDPTPAAASPATFVDSVSKN